MKNTTLPALISVLALNIVCSAQVFNIDPFSLKLNGETEVISLAKTGEVAINGRVAGQLSRDGRLTGVKGEIIGSLSNLGLITDSDNVSYGLIDTNGSIDLGTHRSIVWTNDGKLKISEDETLSISSNRKKSLRTASFLIFINFWMKRSYPAPTAVELRNLEKFRYNDSDVVMSIETGMCNGDCESLLLMYGNGKITYRGGGFAGMTKVGKTTRAKINQLLQKAEDIDFPHLPIAPPRPYVHDGSSTTTMVWYKGRLLKTGCEVGEGCPQESVHFREFVDRLFSEEFSKLIEFRR